MIDEKEIERVAESLGRVADAFQVILFGSYARGEANENSDVDLMIIAESDLPKFKRSRELYKLFRPYPFGMDLVVYTPKEIERGKKSMSLSFQLYYEKVRRFMYEDMEIARQWLAKARNDLLNADNNLKAEEVPFDTVCFHCQQAAEKFLKAYLVGNGGYGHKAGHLVK